MSCITSVDGIHDTLVMDLIGQLRRDVIGRLSVRPDVIGYCRTVKQSSFVSQIVRSPVVLS